MKNPPVKTRFAPSPTGRMHLGNLRTALFNALFAASRQGVFLLRSEDTDAARSRDEYLESIMQDLHWLGLPWQEGPDVGGQSGPYLQSARDSIYAAYFDVLRERGLSYPCFCTETELKLERKLALQAHRPPRYSGRCARLDPAEAQSRVETGVAHTLRFRVPAGREVGFEDLVRGKQSMSSTDIGDFVIRRADGSPAFFFSNAVDDALMGVTHVLRGEDHLTNTPRQLLLLEALGLAAPDYGHISLIVDERGGPLSKRSGSAGLQALRVQGFLPGAILNHLARLGHHSGNDAYLDRVQLVDDFDVRHLGRAPARHDMQQLMHWQKLAVSALSEPALREWLADWQGPDGERLADIVPEQELDTFVAAVRENLVLPADIMGLARTCFTDVETRDAAVVDVIRAAGPEFFDHALAAHRGAGQAFAEFASAVGERSGRKGKQLFMPLRAALTHALNGPEMARLMPLLGAARVEQRLLNAGQLAREGR